MTLTLRAVSLNDQPLTQPITAHFDAQGGTIGRSDHNTMALPDPERHISRQQAQISAGERGYRIQNIGSANPISVRGRALAQGETSPLAHSDQVRIGGYLLEVIEEPDDGEAGLVTRGRAVLDTRTPPPRGPGVTSPGFGDLSRPLTSGNPFADLLGPATPPPPRRDPAPPAPSPAYAPQAPATPAARPGAYASVDPFAALGAAGLDADSPAWNKPETPTPSRLPDDFDPLAAPPTPAAAAKAPAPAAGAFDDLIPQSPAGSSIDSMFGLNDPARGEPLANFLNDLPPAGAARTSAPPGLSTDPLALFGGAAASPAPPAKGTSQHDHTPELRGAFRPPAIAPAPAVPAPAPAVRPAAAIPPPIAAPAAPVAPIARPLPVVESVSGDAQALWQHFCAGAGIAYDRPEGVTPELMHVLGSLLRSATDGALQMLAVRAATKHELHAAVTVIQSRNNNPLKFSPDAQAALEQLLQPPARGFLSGPAAMNDAMNELVGHTIGTVAGMRAALEGVMNRFRPDQVEAKLVGAAMLDRLLPMNRKARLWELYLTHFDTIRDEAQEDFHTLFGKAFLAAYEQQQERLRREKAGK